MQNQNNEQQKRKHLEFKQRGFILVAIRKRADKLFSEGKINKKQKNEIKERLKEEWRKVYNRHPYISQSIKQGFNLLYT
jgi:tRNA nucleotidyltransferase (CCA-adding enzyme)